MCTCGRHGIFELVVIGGARKSELRGRQLAEENVFDLLLCKQMGLSCVT